MSQSEVVAMFLMSTMIKKMMSTVNGMSAVRALSVNALLKLAKL